MVTGSWELRVVNKKGRARTKRQLSELDQRALNERGWNRYQLAGATMSAPGVSSRPSGRGQ